MARNPRGLVRWTLWLSAEARGVIKTLAESVSQESDRKIRQSAVGRALMVEALADPELVERAKKRAAEEPPSGVARLTTPE